MRSASLIPRSVTSISMRSGMSPGRHSTSMTRMMSSRIPPSVFTPRASPLTATGTLTRSGNVHGNPIEVGVKKILLHRIHLPLFQNCRCAAVLAAKIQFQNRVAAGLGTKNPLQHFRIDGNRHGFALSAIDDGRNQTFDPQAPRSILATIGPCLQH